MKLFEDTRKRFWLPLVFLEFDLVSRISFVVIPNTTNMYVIICSWWIDGSILMLYTVKANILVQLEEL
jgi:hypothetical protein